jgi:hypothetical protein
MEAKKCDRKSCGKFFEPKKNVDDKVHIFANYWRNYDNSNSTYDLCPDCMKKLKDFLEGKNDN